MGFINVGLFQFGFPAPGLILPKRGPLPHLATHDSSKPEKPVLRGADQWTLVNGSYQKGPVRAGVDDQVQHNVAVLLPPAGVVHSAEAWLDVYIMQGTTRTLAVDHHVLSIKAILGGANQSYDDFWAAGYKLSGFKLASKPVLAVASFNIYASHLAKRSDPTPYVCSYTPL